MCMYSCLSSHRATKNWGTGPYNSLRHADDNRYFSGLSLTWNWREGHKFYLAKEVGKFWHVLGWEKSNFIIINEFKYGQTWKTWPSPLVYHFISKDMKDWVNQGKELPGFEHKGAAPGLGIHYYLITTIDHCVPLHCQAPAPTFSFSIWWVTPS